MREIEQTIAFKKDLRREGKGPNLTILNVVLPDNRAVKTRRKYRCILNLYAL